MLASKFSKVFGATSGAIGPHLWSFYLIHSVTDCAAHGADISHQIQVVAVHKGIR